MANERIDIEVTDKGADKAAKNLRSVASNADKAADHVDRLRALLATLPANQLLALGSSSRTVQQDLSAINGSIKTLESELTGLSTRVGRASTAFDRLTTSQQRASNAVSKASTSTRNAGGATGDYASRAHALKAALDPLYAAQSAFNAEVAEAKALYQAGAINIRTYTAAVGAAQSKLNATKVAQDQMNNSIRQGSNATKLAGHHQANLVAQLNDIGVSLASGQKPWMVLIQQGSQLQDLSMRVDGGFKTLAASAARLLARFIPLAAGVGVLAVVFKDLNKTANDTAGMDAYIKSLGLTKKEIKELENTHVTMGDTLKATWTVLSQTLLSTMGLTTQDISDAWSATMDFILKAAQYSFAGIGAGAVTLVKFIAAVVGNVGKIFYNAGVVAANLFLKSIEVLVNGTIKGINAIGGAINWLSTKAGFGDVVGQLGEINLGVKGVTDGVVELSGFDFGATFKQHAQTGIANMQALGGAISEVSQQLAKDRIAEQAKDIIEDRPDSKGKKGPKPKVDRTAENRAHALAQVNLQLNNELKSMRLLSDERAIQNKMDQITEALAQKKIKLTDGETKAIRAKVDEIERFKEVQSEMDRIYADATGPLKTYNAAQEAAKILLDGNKISQEQYAQAVAKATRAYQEATDPLMQMREALDQQERTLGLFGDALEQANYYEQIRQQLLSKGVVLSATYVAGVNSEVDALMRRNQMLIEEGRIRNTIGQMVQPYEQEQQMLANKQLYYDELQRLRDADIISEQSYQRAKLDLDMKFNQQRLQAQSDFFGALASLTSRGHGVIGAISKAAAVAQATIDGYVAVQKALASAPPPWNMLAAAAVAIKTGANVASILSTNVGSYAAGGQFIVGGRDGVDANNINMNVTKGERVTIETQRQQRENDAAAQAGGQEPPVVNVKSVNVVDPRMALDALSTSEGNEVFVNRIEANAAQIRAVLGVG